MSVIAYHALFGLFNSNHLTVQHVQQHQVNTALAFLGLETYKKGALISFSINYYDVLKVQVWC